MEYIKIGRIVNTHGLRGEVRIESFSDFDDVRYRKNSTVYILFEGVYTPFRVDSFRVHKAHPLVSFREHRDINLIEKFKGCDLFILASDRHALPEGEYYADELIGMRVVDEDGTQIGEVADIEETRGAQKNLRIRMDSGKTFLLPDIPQFVLKVMPEEKTIRIHMDGGLL